MKELIRQIPGAAPLWHMLRSGKAATRAWVMKRHGPQLRRIAHRNTLRLMITGTKGKTTTTTMVATIMSEAGYRVGYCNTDGVYIEGRMVHAGDSSGFKGAHRVLTDPAVTCAVLETARGDLANRGLYIATCHAAALLNIGWDHVGTDGIDTQEAMLKHKRQVTDASRGRVVLNAEDRLVAPLVRDYGVQRTTFFALDPAAVADHLAQGGEAVTLTEGPDPRIVHRSPAGDVEIMPVADIPAALGGRVPFIVANALAATALARAAGVVPKAISSALSEFGDDASPLGGRFRLLQGYPFEIAIDRGHDVSGLEGFFSGITSIRRPEGRLIAMLTAVGNRPDWTFDKMAEIAWRANVDHYVLFDSDIIRRNRRPSEIPKRIGRWLETNGVQPERINIILDVRDAVRKVITDARPGDLLCFLGEHPNQGLEAIVLDELKKSEHSSERALNSPN